MLRESGGAAILDRGIGTFEQLAERWTGRRLAELAPAPVRDALLVQALDEVAVPEFRQAAAFPGFRRAALRVFKEVKASEAVPGASGVAAAADRLRAAGEAIGGGRGAKVAGLGRALAAYQRRLESAGLLDHEDLLRLLLDRVRARPPARLRLFALDGFTDLTEVQERIVQAVVERADRSLVAVLGSEVAADRAADDVAAQGPFAASGAMRRRLSEGSAFREERLEGNRRATGDLARLDRLLAGEPVEPAAPDGSVRFLAGADPDDEADRVARACLGFLADGIPRNEVLVVVRRLDGETAARVLDALRRHGVPARRMGAVSLGSVPAVRAALRVLRLLAGCEEATDARDALRAGDARDVVAREADALDAVAALEGVEGLEALTARARQEGLPSCEAWLQAVAAERLGDAPRAPAEIVARAFDALPRIVAFSYESSSDVARAAADASALRGLRSLADNVARGARAAGHATLAPAELVRRIAAAVDGARTAVPDRRVDVVNVVDAEEARQWEARAVVVAGLRMGEFPVPAREDLFVADPDRAEVERATRVRLPSRVEEALRREHLLFYAAATRARERLVLTAPVSDEKGDPALPSPFLVAALGILPEELRRLDGATRSPGDVRPAPGETFHRDDLVRTALASLTERYASGTGSERRARAGLALLGRLVEEDSGARGRLPPDNVLAQAARWFRERPRPLARVGAARAALAAPRARSASSLQDFAQCAFRHFASRSLALGETRGGPDDGLDAMTAGTVVHRALELAFRGGRLTPEAAAESFEAAWAEFAGRLRPGLALARERSRMRAAVLRRVADEAQAQLAPGFTPAWFEQPFGDAETPLAIGAVRLRGCIDRVDLDAQGRAVVIDYKWSAVTRFAGLERKLAEGLELQLPLYAIAVEDALGHEVVAAGYVTLRDGGARWLRFAPEAPRAGRADVSWMGEEGDEGMANVRQVVVALDARIRGGGVAVEPRDPKICGFCAFGDLCRYEGRRS